MKRKYVLWGALFALVIIIGVGLTVRGFMNPDAGSGMSEATPYRAGPFQVGIEVKPERPVVGDNLLHIRVHDQNGVPLSGVDIWAVAEMPAMGAMPAMRAPAEMEEIAPGLYEGEFELSMAGAWPLTLQIAKEDVGEAQLSFDMASGRAGLRLSSGAEMDEMMPGMAPPAQSIRVDTARRQRIGLTTQRARIIPMTREIRAYGEITYDTRRMSDISLKYDAWVEDLRADYIGVGVRKGDILFTYFAPDLHAAQQEYLDILKRGASNLEAAAARRLGFWGMTSAQIAQLGKNGRVWDAVPYLAPHAGVVVEKPVVDGSGVKAGMTLLRIADLSAVWVEAEVYEDDLPHIRTGMTGRVKRAHGQAAAQEAHVEFIYPMLDRDSRTARVRFTVPNPDGVLKPGMYADIRLDADLGERLAVPHDAVLVSGDTRFVFEDLGNGSLVPRQVITGERAGDMVEIVSGLSPGALIVTSGNFLIASETKLKTGIKQW